MNELNCELSKKERNKQTYHFLKQKIVSFDVNLIPIRTSEIHFDLIIDMFFHKLKKAMQVEKGVNNKSKSEHKNLCEETV